MIALVLLNGKGLPPLGQTNDDISHWVANVVTSRRQIERELPSRSPLGNDSASCRRKNYSDRLKSFANENVYFRKSRFHLDRSPAAGLKNRNHPGLDLLKMLISS
jgi:hypothetical protein